MSVVGAPGVPTGRDSRIAVIGAAADVAVYELAGALTLVAESTRDAEAAGDAEDAGDAEAVRAAWRALPTGVAVVLLTPAAAAALADEPVGRDGPLRAVMPG